MTKKLHVVAGNPLQEDRIEKMLNVNNWTHSQFLEACLDALEPNDLSVLESAYWSFIDVLYRFTPTIKRSMVSTFANHMWSIIVRIVYKKDDIYKVTNGLEECIALNDWNTNNGDTDDKQN